MASDVIKDSVETLSHDLNRQLSSRAFGRVRKGVASAQATVPTIPSKYFTVLTDNNEKKGFQRTSKRFDYNFVNSKNFSPIPNFSKTN